MWGLINGRLLRIKGEWMEYAQGDEINGVPVFVCFVFTLAEVPVIFEATMESLTNVEAFLC